MARLSGIAPITLRLIREGRLDHLRRVDPQAFADCCYLVVQYLREEAERIRSTHWHRAQILLSQADQLTSLFNLAFCIPTERSMLDGPTEWVRGEEEEGSERRE